MEKVYPMMSIALIDLSLAMMVFLYSKVVQALWLKRNDDTQLTCQQKVSVKSSSIMPYSVDLKTLTLEQFNSKLKQSDQRSYGVTVCANV